MVLHGLYEKMLSSRKAVQTEGIQLAKTNDKYKGRKPVYVNMIFFTDLLNQVKNKEISVVEASNKLGISKDKFYRLWKQQK